MNFTGNSWSIPRILSDYGQLHAAGCSSHTSCIAAGDSGTASSGNYSIYNGKKWSRLMLNTHGSLGLTSISCLAPPVDNGSRAVVFNGGSVTAPATIDTFNLPNLTSCATYWHCVAMDSGGSAVIYDAPRVQIQRS
ncbi:MAG: hypothetical protein ACRDPA_35315 [Solirubrobacteraceae bacterium]